MDKELKKKINALPERPGVYIMKSAAGEVLYVGKAVSLKRRVSGYFRKSVTDPKTVHLVSRVSDIEIICCDTAAQALILEASLIKERRPKYNTALRDDKSYPYIEVTRERFPRIFVTRPKERSGSRFFGPYPNAKETKEVLKLIRRVFPYCSCRRRGKKPCFYYHLNLCPAPEATGMRVSEYKKNIDNICKVLTGEKRSLIVSLEKKMTRAARQGAFEEAADCRDKLFAVYNLYTGKAQLHQLIFLKKLLGLSRLPLLIEAIDISNLKGEAAVGSVIIFKDGIPDKSCYRKFRIKTVTGQDDYGMVEEVVARRYRRLKEGPGVLPDMLIIDGGLAHANIAAKIISHLGLTIPVVGIAKANEELWSPGARVPYRIPRDNAALKLIQWIRDEAHRFAHSYHTVLRKKRMFTRNERVSAKKQKGNL